MTPKMTDENKENQRKKRRPSVIASIITTGALAATIVIGAVSCTSCQKNNINPDNLQSESTDLESTEVNFNEEIEINSPVNVDVAESETELLMCLIASEAPYASDEVMTAIAAVVLNRVKEVEKYQFPNTVTDVVFQTDQFDCVHKGELMPINSLEADTDLYSKTFNAVRAAQNGYDPTNGALFFFEVKEGTVPFPNGQMIENYSFAPDWPEEWIG